MAYRITLNGTNIMEDTEENRRKEERQALASLLVTKSTDSGSAQKSAEFLGGMAYAELLAGIDGDSVVEVYETPEGKNVEKIRAKYTVKALTARVVAAATQEDRQGEIFEYDTDKPAKKNTDAKSVVLGLV